MRQMNFEPIIGSLHTNLLGDKLSVVDNDKFCKDVKGEDNQSEFNPYNKMNSLVYVVPGPNDAEDEQNSSSANVVVNLLMQLKAFQQNNNILRNTELLKQQIIKQLKIETNNISSTKVKDQIKLITKNYENNLLKNEDINKTVNYINAGLKKNI